MFFIHSTVLENRIKDLAALGDVYLLQRVRDCLFFTVQCGDMNESRLELG